eukprot:GFYU01004367.1.p1 GENE.GFYU01004367.1~~GFYU01004367.1.p1  ORF type:complete len:436 (-),score=-29.53 GFYU01004367.1:466-1773(-)
MYFAHKLPQYTRVALRPVCPVSLPLDSRCDVRTGRIQILLILDVPAMVLSKVLVVIIYVVCAACLSFIGLLLWLATDCFVPWSREVVHYTCRRNSKMSQLVVSLPAFQWVPTVFLRLHSHFNTLAATTWALTCTVYWSREVFELSDGEKIAIDIAEPPNLQHGDIPTYVVFPGGPTGGSSSSHYVLAFAARAVEDGQRVVVANHRGCGGLVLRAPRTTLASDVEDMQDIISACRRRFSGPTFLLGFAFGASMVIRYACTPESLKSVTGVMAVSPLWGSEQSRSLLHRIATVLSLKQYIWLNRTSLASSGKNPLRLLLSSWTARAMTTGVTDLCSFGHGQRDYELPTADIVTRISCPTLLLAAADDALHPVNTVPLRAIEDNENVVLALTGSGGHLSWYQGSRGGFYIRLVMRFATEIARRFPQKPNSASRAPMSR